MLESLGYIATGIIMFWAIVGCYIWQRYGLEGVQFCWSLDFPRALHTWQAARIEERERAALQKIAEKITGRNPI